MNKVGAARYGKYSWNKQGREGRKDYLHNLFRLLTAALTLSLTAVISSTYAVMAGTSLATAPDVPWTSPTQLAIHNTGPADTTGREYICTPLTFRMIDDPAKTMHDGCFVQAAFGMIDPDKGIGIFNGTDEGEAIKQGGNIAALSILPYSASVAQFSGFPGLGSYMYIYPYFPNALEQRLDLTLHRYKEISGAPSFLVTDADGQPLTINTTALAYAAGGQWMVTESPAHALVRVNLATFDVLPFGPSFFTQSNPYANHRASMAITEDGRYAAAASNEFASFTVHDLRNCSGSCPWHNYWSYIASQVAGTLQSISRVNFVTDSTISFIATTNLGSQSYLLSPNGRITSLIPYLGLGDSYTSGQGAWNYTIGTDTKINKCHLSIHSYPLRLSGDVFGNQGHSVACSGARLHDVGSESRSYTGQAGDGRSAEARQADGTETTILHDFSPGYLAQGDFVRTYQPGIITVGIGGNDVGFKDIMLRCVSPVASIKPPALNPNNCYQSYEDRLEVAQAIDRTYAKWVQLYTQLRQWSPGTHVYAIGYPQIVSTDGGCERNAPFTLSDRMFARNVTLYLNSVIKRAAQSAGVYYVDITDALKGYELCSGQSGQLGVNGITAGTDAVGILGQESFHPTALGQELIEQAILYATHNLTTYVPTVTTPAAPPSIEETNSLLQAPHTGREVRHLSFDTLTNTDYVTVGDLLSIHATGINYGLLPNTDYTVTVSGSSIGTIHSDNQAVVDGNVTVPAGSPTGEQPLTITGPGQSEDTAGVTQVIYVGAVPGDIDGDGTLNTYDSCPAVTNSNFDEDKDDIDDTCDSSVHARLQVSALPRSTVATRPSSSTQVQHEHFDYIIQPAALGSPSIPHFPWYWWLAFITGGLVTIGGCRMLLHRIRI